MPPAHTPDPNAVHCPHCGAAPGQPCSSPSGLRRVNHAERMHLAYALLFPEANFYRAEAERYRMKHPDVDPRQVICAPSRRQALWWAQWGRTLRYDQATYEAEHGPDTSMDAPTPEPEDDYVGPTVSEVEAMIKSAGARAAAAKTNRGWS